ncbi:hypothetical protein [Pontiella sulfatireligans]|uniref:Uncharacterized protein n=1 Tax=Pontiella sulfatireligans TaxID=2750658 RepID=A0A6C2UEQ9_9BACT|nr:hypothetical protein [Pontiella sulfatireligans]VGO18399.1 hypothetical protein SCARR_00451 [Pontiella sulfatireligans]
MKLIDKYAGALTNLPSSGSGGCHTALLGIANLGVLAGLTEEQIHRDLHNAAHGSRHISDNEIIAATQKARQENQPLENGAGYHPRPISRKSKPRVKPEYRDRLIERGSGVSEQDITNASPVPLNNDQATHAYQLLNSLYSPDDHLFIGTKYDTDVKTVHEWEGIISASGPAALPHYIPNPVSGLQRPARLLVQDSITSGRVD